MKTKAQLEKTLKDLRMDLEEAEKSVKRAHHFRDGIKDTIKDVVAQIGVVNLPTSVKVGSVELTLPEHPAINSILDVNGHARKSYHYKSKPYYDSQTGEFKFVFEAHFVPRQNYWDFVIQTQGDYCFSEKAITLEEAVKNMQSRIGSLSEVLATVTPYLKSE